MALYKIIDVYPLHERAAVLNGTSTFDATSRIQEILSYTGRKQIVFPEGGQVTQSTRLYLYSHDTEIIANNCQLFHIGQNYHCNLWFEAVNNWSIRGAFRVNGNIQNRPVAQPGQGEAGIYIRNCENVDIGRLASHFTYSDGLEISATSTDPATRSKNIRIDSLNTELNGRNGISFTGAVDVLCTHVQTKGNGFSPPCSGIAFEPDYGLRNENITIVEPSCTFNAGHGLYLSGPDANGQTNLGINIIGGRFTNNGGWGISKGGSDPALIGSMTFANNGQGNVGP